jgi:hypothetical protein
MTFLKALRRGVHHIGHLKPARLIHDVKHVINEVKNEYSKGKQWAINHGGLPVKILLPPLKRVPSELPLVGPFKQQKPPLTKQT